jgi:hypothetical protein
MLKPDEEMEQRANFSSEWMPEEEVCASCGKTYEEHATKIWYGMLATVCPNDKGVFRVPDRGDVLED